MREMPVIKSLNMETYGEEIRYGEQIMNEKVKQIAEKISSATDIGSSAACNIITDTLDLFNSGAYEIYAVISCQPPYWQINR